MIYWFIEKMYEKKFDSLFDFVFPRKNGGCEKNSSSFGPASTPPENLSPSFSTPSSPPPPSLQNLNNCSAPIFLIFLKKIVHLVYSTSWKFSLDIVCIYIICIIFSRNIFTPLCSKSETSAHTRLTITRLYILLANVLTWCQLETFFKDTPW